MEWSILHKRTDLSFHSPKMDASLPVSNLMLVKLGFKTEIFNFEC